ncbi:MAG: apolipoprotein N-acyltransferase, partial [Planctomycetota bacterium]
MNEAADKLEPVSKTRDADRPRHGFLSAIGLVAVFAVMATLSFAPYNQFYLGWLALTPLMLAAAMLRSPVKRFAAGYVGGLLYFAGSFWSLHAIGIFAMLGLLIYLALYPAVFAASCGALSKRATTGVRTLGVVGMAAVTWAGLEYLRGIAFTGLPMVVLGQSQTPLLRGIQIADATSIYGVSFWCALLSAATWAIFNHRRSIAMALPSVSVAFAVVAGVFAYGSYRIAETVPLPGPTVLLLQPNEPLINTELPDEDADLNWHFDRTISAMDASPDDIDLVIWGESVVPFLNRDFLLVPLRQDVVDRIQFVMSTLSALSRSGPDFLVGGGYARWQRNSAGETRLFDRRNSMYFFTEGQLTNLRYDKQHLVPFGEFVPFRTSGPPMKWLHDFFQLFNPFPEDFFLVRGEEQTVFPVETEQGTVRVVAPICFEDLFAYRTRELVFENGERRADLIANATNDGWFRGPHMDQHLQLAVFRCIETRTPMARAVNTGVSA